jgi:DMSO/TMAO reductase YedYZ molybdopterin-dependent catalytic subunit
VLLEGVDPQGDFAMAYSYGGYTTNLALADLTGGKAWVVTEHEGEPLPREHGGPPACWCRTSTSGRAPSESPACA